MRHRAVRALAAGICLIGFAAWCVHTQTGRAAPLAPEQPSGAVELKDVKYQALCEAVRAQRGKVVVVDLWGFF